MSALRDKTIELIEQTDDQFLKIVHDMLLAHQVSSHPVKFTIEEQQMLLQRREEMLSGKVKGIPLKTSISNAKKLLDKKKK